MCIYPGRSDKSSPESCRPILAAGTFHKGTPPSPLAKDLAKKEDRLPTKPKHQNRTPPLSVLAKHEDDT